VLGQVIAHAMIRSTHSSPITLPASTTSCLGLNLAWVIVFVLSLAYFFIEFQSGRLCALMGTDFRGYYASGQIVRQHGFSQVYNPVLQDEFQSTLYQRCPAPAIPQPMPRVATPYLPVFILFFLPLTALEFTTAYLVWTAFNLLLLALYLCHFARVLGLRLSALSLAQWTICLPVIASLYLGQSNLWLALCLGECVLAGLRNHPLQSGQWLGGLLLKPHTLVLFFPGLILARWRQVLAGFSLSALIVLGGSILLAGFTGLRGSLGLMFRFAGPLIQTAPTMTNWRSLALNLDLLLPGWLAWSIGIVGMLVTIWLVLSLWRRNTLLSDEGFVLLVLVTYAGTCALSWHSHFYLFMPLIPLLLYLDGRGRLPLPLLAAWLLGPPIWFGIVSIFWPDIVRNLFGLGMLALDLAILIWGRGRFLALRNSPR
jgi:hypothetical protein